jgi:uncharacterized protein (TIGR02271 family)
MAHLICIVDTQEQASSIVKDLTGAGIGQQAISVLFPDQRGTRDFAHEKHTKAPEGAIAGVGTGGAIGGALGWMAGIGSLAIPGIGPFIAAGPLLATLGGAAAGAAVGGITGGLIGMGIPEYEARRYEGKIHAGGILISTHLDEHQDGLADRVKDIYTRGGAHDIASARESRPRESRPIAAGERGRYRTPGHGTVPSQRVAEAGERDEAGTGSGPVAKRLTETGTGRLIGYAVLDEAGEQVGEVSAIWEDETGQAAYAGVRTGWLGLGRMHVVPTVAAEVDDANRRLRVPVAAEVIKQAPSFTSDDDITEDAQRQVIGYYEEHGLRSRSAVSRAWLERGPAQPRETQRRPAAEPAKAGSTTTAPVESEPVVTAMAAEPRPEVAPSGQSLQAEEERLVVGKRQVEAGGVRLRKVVRTEVVDQPVTLQREEVVVERVPGGAGAPAAGPGAAPAGMFEEQELFIPLYREEPVIAKETVVREEVRVRKTNVAEERQVSEPVRREDVQVENTPAAEQEHPAHP